MLEYSGRLLYVRLLLLRPVLLQPAFFPQNRIQNHIVVPIYKLCIETVDSLISLLHKDLGGNHRCSAGDTIYFTLFSY